MSDLRRTTLFDFHQAHGARFVGFGGWEMPVQYTSIIEEHKAVRTTAGLFDVGHMGEVRVSGPGAETYLNTLVTNDVARLKDNRGLYTPMCYGDGGVVDDLIIYRRGREDFLLVINAANIERDFTWMQEIAEPFDCVLENQSDAYGLLALQGPHADAIAAEVVNADLAGLKRFAMTEAEMAGVAVIVARTGYTGEAGFEIFCPAAEAPGVGEALLRAGSGHGLQLAGLGARDSLRLEAGYPLYGHEISEKINPLRGGIGWTVKFKKETAFIGRTPLEQEAAEGIPEKICFFKLEGRRIGRPGTPVLSAEGETVGEVVSGTYSPMLEQPIGSALVQAAALEAGGLQLDLRGNRADLQVASPPLRLAG